MFQYSQSVLRYFRWKVPMRKDFTPHDAKIFKNLRQSDGDMQQTFAVIDCK